jgi:hypothetical protein
MNLQPSAFTLCVLFCAAVSAQQDFSEEFKAVPAWPASNIPPADLKGKYVYLDAAAKQMVLAYPENLDQPDFASNPGRQRVDRFDLNNQVEATFSVAIKREEQRQEKQPPRKVFTYSYAVANSSKARQAIERFDVVAPEFRAGDPLVAAAGWQAAAGGSSINAVRVSIGQASGAFISWYIIDPRKPIGPGTALSGFSLSSELKPGFVVAYVRGGQRPKLTSEIPEAVLRQTVPLLQREYNSQNVLTIGPKFSATASVDTVVQDFRAGINRLVDAKRLDSESAAVKEALQLLAKAGEAPQQAMRAQPKQGLEAEIIGALKLSLGWP